MLNGETTTVSFPIVTTKLKARDYCEVALLFPDPQKVNWNFSRPFTILDFVGINEDFKLYRIPA